MAGALFYKSKEKLLSGSIHMLTDTIKLVLVDHTDHDPDVTTDEYLSAIDAAGRVATSGQLQNPTVTNGVFDADDIVISSVSGHAFDSIVVFKDTGDAATSPLIAKITDGSGLPGTPDGGNVTITFSSAASKIFAI